MVRSRVTRQHNNVLVTCGGKWVGMILQLRRAMCTVPELSDGQIIVASMERVTPASCFADASVVVPPINDAAYIDALIQVCHNYRVRVLIPLIDLDLVRICNHLQMFSDNGTTVICPEPHLVKLCYDKRSFQTFLEEEGLPFPRTYQAHQLADAKYPLFYKARWGFGSMGSGICTCPEEIQRVVQSNSDVIIQEYVAAPEISVDAYIARSGRCIICVPRMRDKVVAGEAYRTHTIDSPGVRRLAMNTIAALSRRGLRGPLNIQVFDAHPDPLLIEVNTRLGSASVLSNMASQGRFFSALLSEGCGKTVNSDPDDYQIGLCLYRYLGDVFYDDTGTAQCMPDRESR